MMVDIRKLAFLCSGLLALCLGGAHAAEHHDHDQHDEHDGHDHDDDDHDHEDHDDHRAHGVHVHGAWEMFAALDDARLTVTMKGPLVDVLGFERLPETDEERASVVELKERVMSYQTMLALDDRVRCEASEPAAVVLPEGFLTEVAANSEEHADDDHDHAHHDEHDDDHHDEHDIHKNDLEVTYVFNCASPTRLRSITMSGFDAFPAIESVEAVFLGDAKQVAGRLTRDSQTLAID